MIDEDEDRRPNQREAQDDQELEALMRMRPFRHLVARILLQSGVSSGTFSSSALEMARNEGRREVGMWLRDEMLRVNPDQFLNIMKEMTHV